MKRVSFKVAKAIKEAGYPQIGQFRTHDSDFYAPNGEKESSMEFDLIPDGYVYAPFYLEVWLWLWREKKINVIPEYDQISGLFSSCGVSERDDPEEAIIAAIEYLVDKNLIK